MATRIYVGNLPYTITQDQLSELFTEFGTVESATVVTDRHSGRSKGFGFVEMSSTEECKAAISELNEKEYEGRRLIVSEARPREERPARGYR